jgi:DNA replication protein DnaD
MQAVFERSGKPARIISPLEWECLREWMEYDYPLRIVLRAISDTSKRASNLTYYRQPVRVAMQRWYSVM